MTNDISSIYNNIKTFDELCLVGCDFIINKIKTHPFLIVDQTKDNLYELVREKYEFIRNYLFQYNSMGFYTVMSQPGSDYPTQIYPTYLDYKKSFDLDKNNNNDIELQMNNSKFGVKQRAEVEGFIKIKKGLKLHEILKNDPRIKIGISTIPKSYPTDIIDFSFKSIDNYATLSYEKLPNGKIRFMEMESENNETIRKEFEGYDRNYKLTQLYHVVKRYYVVRTYPLKKHIPNLLDVDIIGISIMDLEWDSNDYLWEKIYLALKNI